MTETLCWTCRRLDCSWVMEYKPVEGWEAEPKRLLAMRKSKRPPIDSFTVIKCPLYEKKGEPHEKDLSQYEG